MTAIRTFLFISTVMIYVMSLIAAVSHGINWPAVAINDLLALNWRSQFNADFISYLLIVATWISWREGLTTKGYIFGFLSIFMGGMFTFPYLLYATCQAKGSPKEVLFGMHK